MSKSKYGKLTSLPPLPRLLDREPVRTQQFKVQGRKQERDTTNKRTTNTRTANRDTTLVTDEINTGINLVDETFNVSAPLPLYDPVILPTDFPVHIVSSYSRSLNESIASLSVDSNDIMLDEQLGELYMTPISVESETLSKSNVAIAKMMKQYKPITKEDIPSVSSYGTPSYISLDGNIYDTVINLSAMSTNDCCNNPPVESIDINKRPPLRPLPPLHSLPPLLSLPPLRTIQPIQLPT